MEDDNEVSRNPLSFQLSTLNSHSPLFTMAFPTFAEADELKRTWTDKFVRVKSGLAQYERFAGKVGRVVTVNYGGKALIDFADGAWYDIPATADFLELVTEEEAKGKYDSTANSAQKLPGRQG
jgi:hypothetical protein